MFGRYFLALRCPCGTSRHIEPEAHARIAGRSATFAALAERMRCSQCGKKVAEVVAVASPRPRGHGPKDQQWCEANEVEHHSYDAPGAAERQLPKERQSDNQGESEPTVGSYVDVRKVDAGPEQQDQVQA